MQALWNGVLAPPPGTEVVPGEDLHLDVETIDALFTELTAAADAGDARAQEIVDRSIRNSAFYLSNLTALLDLDRVVYGGPSWSRVESRYLDLLPQRFAELDMGILTHPVVIEASAVGEDVAAVGAAALVLDSTFSPRVTLR
jgi:predicted NBD/HSP70 family sugar kinase